MASNAKLKVCMSLWYQFVASLEAEHRRLHELLTRDKMR
jgi:hypothetical protein